MANVIAQIRIMPEGLEVDLNTLAAEVKKLGGQSIEMKPIAFGLKAVEAIFVVQDAEGGTENIEEKLRSLEGVSSVEVVSLGREIEEFRG